MTNSEDLTLEFLNSAKQIKNCNKSFENDILLKLYGYYKQATIGDCDNQSPSFWQVKEQAKWESWTAQKGMKKDHAMKRYVKVVSKLLEE